MGANGGGASGRAKLTSGSDTASTVYPKMSSSSALSESASVRRLSKKVWDCKTVSDAIVAVTMIDAGETLTEIRRTAIPVCSASLDLNSVSLKDSTVASIVKRCCMTTRGDATGGGKTPMGEAGGAGNAPRGAGDADGEREAATNPATKSPVTTAVPTPAARKFADTARLPEDFAASGGVAGDD